MGQYYRVYTNRNEKEKVFMSQASLFKSGDFDYYYGQKLTEHSFIRNGFTNYISKYIYKKPTMIAWVGDYADESPVYDKCWGYNNIAKPFPATEKQVIYDTYKDYDGNEREYKYINNKFNYKGKYLVNHTKKLGFKFDDLFTYKDGEYEWTIYPLSILVSIGNGRGGGDYHGTNEQLVGDWCMDIISIEDKLPKCFCEVRAPQFAENYWKINKEELENE